jgi:hypothetical protein
MANTLTTHTLTLDSSKRDVDTYPATNDYRIPLGKSYNGVVAIRLEYASIQQTEHPISDRNNVLVYQVGTAPRRTATVPPGAYTPSGLATAIQTELTSHGDGLTVTYDASTKRVTFSASGAFEIITPDTSMRDVLGIKETSYSIKSAANAYSPPGMVDVAGPRYVQIESPDLDDEVLGVIDISKTPHEFVPRPERYLDTMKSKVSSIGIRITTGGRVYDTGYVDHVLVLKLTTLDTKRLPFNQKFESIV